MVDIFKRWERDEYYSGIKDLEINEYTLGLWNLFK